MMSRIAKLGNFYPFQYLFFEDKFQYKLEVFADNMQNIQID